MENFNVDEFAALALLAQCLYTGTVNQPTYFVEVNREKIVRRLLDGLAQLLTRDPSDNTACSIHFSANSTDEVTLILVRRNLLTTSDRSALTKVLSDISDFVIKRPPTRAFLPRNIGVGSHPDEVDLARLVFPYCLPRLLNKVGGSDVGAVSQSTIQQIDEIITTLSTRDKLPEFKPHLAGRRFASAHRVYDHISFPKAYTSLCESLQSFIKIAKAIRAAKEHDVQALYYLVLLAKQISLDEVYVELYSDLLEQHSKDILSSYMEHLSIYGIALRNVVAMRRTYWRIGDGQRPSKVAITILDSPVSRSWSPPSLSTLLPDHFKEADFKTLPPGIEEAYMQQIRLPLKEHVEMRILDHCISSPGLQPVIYYLGITESPCIMCGRFIRKFKQQGMKNGYVPSHLWNVKGESGIWEGTWLPPADRILGESEEIKRYLGEMKRELIEEIRSAVQSVLGNSGVLCPGNSGS
ncbi:hypothetical protein MMC19_003017 [Ptychographa xylographoides]|nr:hypothetical protein [Ptychographa xylographoides]